MTKRKLNTLKDQVINILENYPYTRDNDHKLFLEVCKEYKKDVGSYPFEQVMLYTTEYGIPSYSSVERARRKAQSERPDLVGTVRELRKNLEKEYIDFALSDNKLNK